MQNTVIIKFKSGTDLKASVAERLNNIMGSEVFNNAEPLFPDETDNTLASIYVANVSATSEISKVLDALNKENEIDYAHVSADKKMS